MLLFYKIYLFKNSAKSSFNPGPIVDEITADFKKTPLTVEGFSFNIASIKIFILSVIFSFSKETLPTHK